MTGHKGTVSFVSRGPSLSAIGTKLLKNRLLDVDWHTNLPRFHGAQADHAQVESSSCCFPKKLVSFDQRHVTLQSSNQKTYLS